MSGPIRLTSDLPDRRVPPAPPRETIAGRFARLEPLDPRAHGADLRAHFAKDDAIWRYMAYGPFPGDDDFRRWLDTRAEPADPLTFAIVDAASVWSRLSTMAGGMRMAPPLIGFASTGLVM